MKKIIYNVLKEIQKGEKPPKYSDFGISVIEFRELIDQIQDDDLIKGASVPRGEGDPNRMVVLDQAKITVKGLNYLENNKEMA